MLYVEKIEDHKIGSNTPFPDVAESLGWTTTIEEENTETAWDGSLWEKGYAPKKPIEVMKTEVRAVKDSYLQTYVDFYQSKPLLWAELSDEEKDNIAKYRLYLKDYSNTKGWYLKNPLTFEEWKKSI